MTESTSKSGVSLYLQLIGLIVICITVSVVCVSFYILNKFEQLAEHQLQHEIIVLAHSTEAAVTPLLNGEQAGRGAIQRYIDRLVERRAQNDIELNILLLQGRRSAIIASNNPDNIEAASYEEHKLLMQAIRDNQPVIYQGVEDAGQGPGNVSDHRDLSTHPDYYIRPGHRFICVSTALHAAGRPVGGINIKMSLDELDRKMGAIHRFILGGLALWLLLVVLCLALLLRVKVFRPLWQITNQIKHFGAAGNGRFERLHRRSDELGVLAREFNAMSERIQRSMEQERQFSADTAHELRTPLAALKSGIQAELLDADAFRRNGREFLEGLLHDVDRLEDLCDSLLLMRSIETVSTLTDIPAREWLHEIQDAVHQSEPIAAGNHCRVRVNVPDCVPALQLMVVDENSTYRIVSNLVGNAIRHGGAGVQIRIDAGFGETAARLSVADNGPGISVEDAEKIFNRFYRGEQSRSRATGGSGLGLSLCQALAGMAGGRIEHTPVSPAGACFTWIVQYAPSAPDSRRPSSARRT